jgi:hypothetical protein
VIKTPIDLLLRGAEKIPGMPDLTRSATDVAYRQKQLQPFVGRLMLVGDFARMGSARKIRQSAAEAATILRKSDIAHGNGTVVSVMTSEFDDAETDSLYDTRDALSAALNSSPEEVTTSIDKPITVENEFVGDSAEKSVVTVYSSLMDTLYPALMREQRRPEHRGAEPDTTFIVITRPQLALRALALQFEPADMDGGRFVALKDIGSHPIENTWKQYANVRPVRKVDFTKKKTTLR